MFQKVAPFCCLIPSTALSVLLLISQRHQWVASTDVYALVSSNRATTQLVVQVISHMLGLANLFAISTIINNDTRILLSSRPISLPCIRFWNAVLTQQYTWDLPPRLLLLLILWLLFCILPAALWAGAITPVVVLVTQEAQIELPLYENTTLLTQDWSDRLYQPSVRNSHGVFAFNVGEMFLGQHLQSASTASTIDGGTSLRSKLDFTSFNYVNRSYGVGASVGLMDDKILSNPLALNYWYLEHGYKSDVRCIYNSSTAYSLEKLEGASIGGLSAWEAKGWLPNSLSAFEDASYVGWGNATIVAIGVYSRTDSTRRMLGIAAGNGYKFLNATQCETFYEPTIFNVSVEIAGKNITISPLTSNESIQNIEPSGMLTFLTNWQFSVIASDQTSLYSSLVGNSFNTSIVNYQAAQVHLHGNPLSIEDATLPGLQNSITAMVDSMLTGYASAQIMVAGETRTAKATIGVQAMRFGDFKYIMAVAAISFGTLVLVVVDIGRTKAWMQRPELDFMNTNDLIMGMAAGYETEGYGDLNIRQAKYFRISLQGLKLVLRKNAPSIPGLPEGARPSLDSLMIPATGSITA